MRAGPVGAVGGGLGVIGLLINCSSAATSWGGGGEFGHHLQTVLRLDTERQQGGALRNCL